MPPKPPFRDPSKVISAAKGRSTTPVSATLARAAPRAPPKPFSPPAVSRPVPRELPSQTPYKAAWYQNVRLRQSARYAAYGTNVIVFFCAVIWVRDHYVRLDHVRGTSMAPTLSPTANETGKEDWVIIRPYMERTPQKQVGHDSIGGDDNPYGLQRGDVVTFWKPHKPEEVGIKRVVAVGGDTVYPKRGYALDPDIVASHRLSGMPDGLPDKDEDAITAELNTLGKVIVPYGHVWIEGDNSYRSLDSNDFGPISKGLVEGKAIWIWRGWTEFLRVGDARSRKERALASTVVHGRSEIPAMFLE